MLTHKVKSGETLARIAKKYGVTVDAIQKANANLIKNVNHIRVGWVLTIPNSSESSEEVKTLFTTALNDIRKLDSVKKLLEMVGV